MRRARVDHIDGEWDTMARVLLMEDDSATREVLKVVLETAGHCVVEVANGVEGLAAARRQPPDVVVTDLAMPLMDGESTVRLLRADYNSPAIAITGEPVSAGRRTRLGTTFRELLVKPIAPRALVDAVHRALRARAG